MGWGDSNNFSIEHLNDSTDDPSQARLDILNAFYELQAVIGGRDTANGVCPLDSNGLVPAANLPDIIVSSTGENLFLIPDTGRVAIQDILNLPQKTVSQLEALASPATGDIANCSDGADGTACLAYYNGTNWLRIALGAQINANTIYSVSTANGTSDLVYLADSTGLNVDDIVQFTGTMGASGLTAATNYYIISIDSGLHRIGVSTTLSGTAVDLTDETFSGVTMAIQ